jgi:hypothetical protein
VAGATVIKGKRGVLALVVGTVGLIACGALLLTLAYRHNVRIDLSPQRGYTLSTHAKKILAAVGRDVHVTVFVRSEDPRTPILKDLLWRVGRETPRISYELVDLNRSPARASRYGIDRYGALVIESGGRRRDISSPSEGALISAILDVTGDHERIAYFITGHGEHSPDSTDRKTGYSTVKRTLEEEFFSVRELPLVSKGGVPADADLVVSAGARKDYFPEELAALRAYRDRGGNLLLLLDPETPASIAGLAADVGVVPLTQVVVDPERRLAAGEGVTVMVSGLEPSFLVSGTLEAPPVFSYARPLMVTDAGKDTVISFLKTGSSSYPAALVPGGAGAPQAPRAPLTVGAAVMRSTEGDARRGRMIVYGDADFATNGVIDYLGNKDLLVNSANWLTREESLIAARQQDKERGREQFFVTAEQGSLAFWLAAVVQPALFLIAGAVVVARRRRQ